MPLPLLCALPVLLAQTPAAQDAGARGSEIVIRVDGEPVERSEFEDWIVLVRGETLAPLFVRNWLAAREARRLGVDDVALEARSKMEEEIRERIDKAYGGDASKWEEELERGYRTPAGRRAERALELERELRIRNIAAHERVVPEEKVEREWNRQYGQDGRRYRVRLLYRRLVVPAMPGKSREEQVAEQERLRAELEAETSKLRDRALAGEPFQGLVRDFSDDEATRASGGRPQGGVLDTSAWPREAIEAISALPPGGISKPLFARGGMWLVQLEELIATPLADVADELRTALAARGPEPNELAAVSTRLAEGVAWEVLPALAEPAPPPGSPDPAVLRIDGVDIGRAEYVRWLIAYHGDAVAKRFGDDRHVRELAAAAKIEATPQEVEDRIDRDLAMMIDFYHRGDREAWEREIVANRGSVEAWRRDQRTVAYVDQLAAELYMSSREITDDLLRQVWTARYGQDGVSLQVRLIRVDAETPELPPDVPPEEAKRRSDEALAAAHKRADEAAQRARDGEDFAALAKRYSADDVTSKNGGELPLGADFRALPPDVVTLIEGLAPGSIGGPVAAGLSFFVVEVLGRREVPFDTVKDALRDELEHAQPTMIELRGHRNVLTRDVKVEVLPALFG